MSCDNLSGGITVSRPSGGVNYSRAGATVTYSRAASDTSTTSRAAGDFCRDFDFTPYVAPTGPIAFSSGFSDGFY